MLTQSEILGNIPQAVGFLSVSTGFVWLIVALVRRRGWRIPAFVIIIALVLAFGSGRFEITDNSPLARQSHTAVVLLDGRVLVAGGKESWKIIASARIYDPSRIT